jgi:Arc/MetJ-type ribon-helix-helix transcriptional regulator
MIVSSLPAKLHASVFVTVHLPPDYTSVLTKLLSSSGSLHFSSASEAALWAAVRALEEKAALHRRSGERIGLHQNMSLRMLDQSDADVANVRRIRDMIFQLDAKLEPAKFESKKAEVKKRKIA